MGAAGPRTVSATLGPRPPTPRRSTVSPVTFSRAQWWERLACDAHCRRYSRLKTAVREDVWPVGATATFLHSLRGRVLCLPAGRRHMRAVMSSVRLSKVNIAKLTRSRDPGARLRLRNVIDRRPYDTLFALLSHFL